MRVGTYFCKVILISLIGQQLKGRCLFFRRKMFLAISVSQESVDHSENEITLAASVPVEIMNLRPDFAECRLGRHFRIILAGRKSLCQRPDDASVYIYELSDCRLVRVQNS